MTTTAHPELEGLDRYKFGWADPDAAGASARRPGMSYSRRPAPSLRPPGGPPAGKASRIHPGPGQAGRHTGRVGRLTAENLRGITTTVALRLWSLSAPGDPACRSAGVTGSRAGPGTRPGPGVRSSRAAGRAGRFPPPGF
jgi:hypothetical protein